MDQESRRRESFFLRGEKSESPVTRVARCRLARDAAKQPAYGSLYWA